MSREPHPGAAKLRRGEGWRNRGTTADLTIARQKLIAKSLGLTGWCQQPGCTYKSTYMWLGVEGCSVHKALVSKAMLTQRSLSKAQIAACRAAGIEGSLPGECRTGGSY